MLQLSDAPQTEDAGDEPAETGRSGLQAKSTRRALLLTALGGLLIAGTVIALPIRDKGPLADVVPAEGAATPSATSAFAEAKTGYCLNWPDNALDAAVIVDCKDDHRFEVSQALDMRAFPGTEYGPDAPPPSPARIQQITSEQCEPATERYLGPRFDPNSRFSISLLWAGDKAWKQSGERRMLCGLQLRGPGYQQLPTKGRVAEADQSKVWPAGTCLGIDPPTNQPNDAAVDCSAPHAMEVVGTVNLGEKFPGGVPADPDQDAYIKEVCNALTDAYLAPVKLRDTTLTLIYNTISLPSWTAGSRQVACSIGATLGNGGWATLINSAKGPLLINGQPPVPPPAIPEERLNQSQAPLPPLPGIGPGAGGGGR